jgi:cell wall-associated NlpC family hydrolase
MLPSWVAPYIGVPHKEHGRDLDGMDCYGILFHVHASVYKIDLPSYAEEYASPLDRAEVAALITGELPGDWQPVPEADAQPGDAVLLRIAGRPLHVGVIAEAPWFLHVMEGRDTCLERLDAPLWARRVLGIYRHVRLAHRPA